MKILMLAWRDMKNPERGGAEIVTDTYLSKLAEKGHDVTLFSSRFPQSREQEDYNGYNITRKGNKLSVYYHGLRYAKANENNFDIIIDQINTIPFFTPLAIKKEKRLAFFHQLCKNIWFYEKSFPVAVFGYILESAYLKLYKDTKALAVSESTKQDLIKYCWNKEKNILVLENKLSFSPIKNAGKKENAFVFCGRLKNSKRIHHCIKALSLLPNSNSKLYIIGDGDKTYKEKLKKLTGKLNLKERVIFTGHIKNKERNKIMQSSAALLATSVREGWGLIVTEANALGTCAITYSTEGLRDANKSGIITKSNTPEALASEMLKLLNNKKLLKEKSESALRSARAYSSWDENIRRFEAWAGG